MPSLSNLSILCFELTTFSITWGICFRSKANSKRYNPTLFGTLLAHLYGVNPSVETFWNWHTCGSMVFPSQTFSSPLGSRSAGKAEASSAGEQLAEE
jgi:hypothetical protein